MSLVYKTSDFAEAFEAGKLMTYQEAADFLHLSTRTIEKYVDNGVLPVYKNHISNKTFIDKTDLLKIMGSKVKREKQVIVYCRAAGLPERGSRHESAPTRLQAQVDRVMNYCTNSGIIVDKVIKEIGPANSFKDRPGIDEIFELVLRRRVSMIVIESSDRLARWASAELFEKFFSWYNVKLLIINQVWDMPEYREEVKDDLANILIDAKRQMGDLPKEDKKRKTTP